jgi:N-acetylglucosaminyldiphosphoundecaprenol N-acetyl-beta-D-mannosaminyltransferase
VPGRVYLRGLNLTSNIAFDIQFFLGSKSQLIDEMLKKVDLPFSYVVTPNINHVVMLSNDKNEHLRKSYKNASYRICDSRLLEPVLKILGIEVSEVIPGSSLTEDLFNLASDKSLSICVIGGSDQDIKILSEKYSSIKISHYNPPMGFINDENEISTCIEFVENNPSSFTLLAVGCPRQEILAHKIFSSGKSKGVGLCIGASISFLSGSTKRAPMWIQKLKLEWLHRIFQEPRRLAGRYLGDAIKFVPLVINEILKK